MNDTVTLDPQGRIDIPETIREALHLQSGQRFVIVTHGDSITLVPERSIAWARGILKGADPANHRDRESTQGKRIFPSYENAIHDLHLLMLALFASLPAPLRSDRERQSQDQPA